MAEEKPFQLGITMAGAISAGAYAGGVFDFLCEALSQWEKHRGAGVPNHRVVIPVFSGASAGAITGALGAVALAGGLTEPTSPETRAEHLKRYPGGCVLPKVYETWVERPSMVGTAPDFLSGEDLARKDANVVSLLNAGLLDAIRDAALEITPTRQPYPFIAASLHVYMTVSNLRGVPYSVRFEGGSHGMQSHGDRAHYTIRGLGAAAVESAWAKDDPGQTLDVAALGPAASAEWRAYTEAALASSAFPAGLAPRRIIARTDDYKRRKWPIEVRPEDPLIEPTFPAPWYDGKDRAYPFLNVDGGLINNEPFEYARYALMADPPEGNERDGAKADRGVLMIDPFPEFPDFLPDDKPDRNLVSLIAALLPVMKNQARFKPAELVLAANERIFSRFLIAPHRTPPGATQEERYAIACGLLGGFGGFLARSFRHHDFQLGRRNCQRFLRESLALPPENPLVRGWDDAAKADARFKTSPDKDGPSFHVVIPLLGTAAEEVPYPTWPRLSQAELDELQRRIEGRLGLVAPRLIERQSASVLVRTGLRAALLAAKSRILDYARYAILSDLVRRDQIEGWDFARIGSLSGFAPLDLRRVLAELAHPAFDGRTAAGIARATSLDKGVVEKIIDALRGDGLPDDRPFKTIALDERGAAGETAYTLAMRRPGGFWRIPGMKQVGQWLAPPSID